MTRVWLATLLVGASVSASLAAPPFTCKANGDSWSVVGTPTHKVACSLRCVLRDASGNQDVATCAPTVSPGAGATPVCEGFLLGKRWTSASLVAAECATVEP